MKAPPSGEQERLNRWREKNGGDVEAPLIGESMNQPMMKCANSNAVLGEPVNLLFAGNDDNPDLLFVEAENDKGESIGVGEWSTDEQGYHVLRFIPQHMVAPPSEEYVDQLTWKAEAKTLRKERDKLKAELEHYKETIRCVYAQVPVDKRRWFIDQNMVNNVGEPLPKVNHYR